jgi:hypothetical protein
MSDFIDDLERELVAAARRRATSRRRRVVLVPRLRPATVMAFVAVAALVLAAFAVVRGLDEGTRPGDERPSVPPGPSVAFALPAVGPAELCPGVEQREQAGGAPQPDPLGIFERPQAEGDAVPQLAGAVSYSWIPAGTIHLDGARRAASRQFSSAVHLVPVAEPRQGQRCDGHREAQLGACLVVAGVAACFSDEEIQAGRAVVLTAPGVVHGIMPDGVARVTIDARRGDISADVHDNAFEAPLQAVEGEQVRVALEHARQCNPSDALLEALPALRDGSARTLPPAVEEALPSGGAPHWVARVEGRGALELWALVRCEGAERACVVGVLEGDWVAQPCATAQEIRRGVSWTFPTGTGVGVAGMAPPGAKVARASRRGKTHEMEITGGVFGAVLPREFGAGDPDGDGAIVDFVVEFR